VHDVDGRLRTQRRPYALPIPPIARRPCCYVLRQTVHVNVVVECAVKFVLSRTLQKSKQFVSDAAFDQRCQCVLLLPRRAGVHQLAFLRATSAPLGPIRHTHILMAYVSPKDSWLRDHDTFPAEL
jgi:hypothetical protein